MQVDFEPSFLPILNIHIVKIVTLFHLISLISEYKKIIIKKYPFLFYNFTTLLYSKRKTVSRYIVRIKAV